MMKAMQTLAIVLFLTVWTTASSQRSFGSCIGSSSSGPATQRCGNLSFFCPVDSMWKERSLRCTGTTTVKPPKRGHFGTVAFVLSSEVVLLSEVAPFLLLNPIQCVRNVF